MFAPFAAHHNTTGIAQLTTFSTTTVLPSKTIPFSATSSAARAIVHVSNGETVAVAAGAIVVGTGIGGFFIFNGITSPIAGGASVVAGSSASAPGDLTNADDPNDPVSTNEPDKIKSDAFDTTTGASPQTSVKPSSPVSTSTSDDTKSDVSGMTTSTTPQTSATVSFPISTSKSDGTKSDTLATTSTTLRTSVTASSARPTSTSTDDGALSWIDHDKVAVILIPQ
ncbi:npp1 domain-containing protein [Colletotrichum chrysophilum]|uniref:Npp1 domain-containing protein n=1 Tax=Colletotrichum chrysophilum TaxID=1836956 RepID=A0AAD9AX16_9PEZI|nr:npp1 domain-containing protein [Colletotrichum chrysophilum]